VLVEVQERFGGYLGWYKAKEALIWKVEDRKAEAFLEVIVPFLRLKRDQAELALQFQGRKKSIQECSRKGMQGFQGMTDEEFAYQKAISDMLKSLKRPELPTQDEIEAVLETR